MNPTCPIHKKSLKEGKYGLFCNQPLTKSSDGEQVLEWCHYKPGKDVPMGQNRPEDTELVSETLKQTKESIKEDKPDWGSIKAKEQDSMFRMSALKAASEVVSAYLSRPDAVVPNNITELLLGVSNRSLMWLKSDINTEPEKDLETDPEPKEAPEKAIPEKSKLEEGKAILRMCLNV